MNYETDTPFDLEKIRLEGLNRIIERALKEFEENPRICWTQLPMEKPLWQTLQLALEKQMPKRVEAIPCIYGDEQSGACAECGSISHTINGHKYCFECGQKLDWD